ncbi:MAG: hypothetical protein R6W81_06215, partial [Bacteroidales bacterium]
AAVWQPEEEEQDACLRRLVAAYDPQRIGVNVSATFAFADGLSHHEHERLITALGPELSVRLVSAEALAIGWLERRTAAELTVYEALVAMAHELIAHAFSRAVITPGETTTETLVWWLRQTMHDHGLHAGEFRIILGIDLARILGVMVGDKVTLVTPSANVTPAGVMPRLKRFSVSGIFDVGMYEYDSAMALVHLDDARTLFRMGDGVTGLRLKLDDLFRAPFVSRELAEELPGIYQVRDWTQYHANFFRAIKTEKTVMFVILLLIIAVAAFNIVSTLVMVVTDKTTDIAICTLLEHSVQCRRTRTFTSSLPLYVRGRNNKCRLENKGTKQIWSSDYGSYSNRRQ